MEYAPASEWVEGRRTHIAMFETERLSAQRVTSIERDAGLRDVFDPTVDHAHHNFLANGVLVHNKSDCLDPGNCTTTAPATETGTDAATSSTGDAGGNTASTTDGGDSGSTGSDSTDTGSTSSRSTTGGTDTTGTTR